MDKEKAGTIVAILSTLGVVFIMMMALDMFPKLGNVWLFIGIVCFLIAGLIKKSISKK